LRENTASIRITTANKGDAQQPASRSELDSVWSLEPSTGIDAAPNGAGAWPRTFCSTIMTKVEWLQKQIKAVSEGLSGLDVPFPLLHLRDSKPAP